MAVVGIDLGTTNTVVAAVRDGRAAALKDPQGRALLPSVVSFTPKGAPKIGYEAKHRRTLDPENTIYSIKRLIGRSWDSPQVQKAIERFPFELKQGPGQATLVSSRGTDYTLPEISARVLERAKQIAEERLGAEASNAVITVPANFNDLQRAATKVAGRTAGLQVLRILNEPTAAALAYGFGKKGRERIAVYDFGGGTFDVTLLDLNQNVFEVLATAGDTFLGGDDLDRMLADRMSEDLLRRHRVDAAADNLLGEQLRAAAEKVKMDLSTRSMARAHLPEIGYDGDTPVDFDFTMRRAEFEQIAEPLVKKSLEVCQEALDIAGLTVKDLDQVLLVGGSTRIPLVRRRISSFFGKMPQSRINPDEVVALGAAIQASALESKMASADLPSVPSPTRRSIPPTGAFPRAPTGKRPPTPATGLNKTLPGTGSHHPQTREGSVLSQLPKAAKTTSAGLGQPGPSLRAPDATAGAQDASTARSASSGQEVSGATGSEEAALSTPSRTVASPSTKRLPFSQAGPGGSSAKRAKFNTLAGVGEPSPPAGAGKTLAGVGEPRSGTARRSGQSDAAGQESTPQTLGGGQGTGPRTLAGIGKAPSAEELAALGRRPPPAPPAPPRDPAPPPPQRMPEAESLAPEDFEDDEVTSVFAAPDSSKGDGSTRDGSVVFELDDLEDEDSQGSARAELQRTQLQGSPLEGVEPSDTGHDSSSLGTIGEEADLPSPTLQSPARASLDDSFPDEGESATTEESVALPSPVEADLPAVLSRDEFPSVSEFDTEAALPTISRPPGPPAKEESPPSEPLAEAEPLGDSAIFSLDDEQAEQASGPTWDEDEADISQADISQADISWSDDDSAAAWSGQEPDSSEPWPEPPASDSEGDVRPESSAAAQALEYGLETPDERQSIRPSRAPLLIDVTPLSLGVEVVGGYVDTLIERNSPIPCEHTRTFANARDHQSMVVVRVSQGEQERFLENTLLGEVQLTGLTDGPRGSIKIDVTFALDESGILQVSARDQATGQAANAQLKLVGVAD